MCENYRLGSGGRVGDGFLKDIMEMFGRKYRGRVGNWVKLDDE